MDGQHSQDRATGYGWHTFRADLLAGLTVAAVAVPQAMAYALIAGLEPQYGLYTAIIMTALASVFGSSKHLINGPTNAISLVVFGTVASLSADPAERLRLVGLLAVLAGLIQLLIALLRLGDLTRYVSESVILGFMGGAGLLVALTQVQNLLGLRDVGDSNSHSHLLYRLWLTWSQGGPIDARSVGVGLATLALVAVLHRVSRRFKVRIPELLASLVLVSLAAWLFRLAPVGAELHLESRLPDLSVPHFTPERIRQLWGGALAVALLGLVEALAIAKSLSARTRQPLDYNRQCFAEGIANLGGGFFQCMPGSGSLTRSAINYFAGGMTRLSGLFSAAAVAATLLLFAPLARYIPRAALAGVLMWTAFRIVDRKRFWYCLRATPFDRNLLLATACAAVFVSIEFSILIGVFLSFMLFVPRVSRLTASELVVSKERVVRERQPGDPPCGKLFVLGLEGQLFFGAAHEFGQVLNDLRVRVNQGVRLIVMRLKRTHNPDMACLERLHHFLMDMQQRKVVVLLCGVRGDFAQMIERLGFHDCLPPERIFLEDAPPENGDGPGLSSTLRAVKRAYELLGDDLCASCPRRQDVEMDKGWYYMI
jgi:SulP family sulfate permease